LLPIDEMFSGIHAQGIGEDAAAAVGRRAQAHDLGAQLNPSVISVVGDVAERRMDGHE